MKYLILFSVLIHIIRPQDSLLEIDRIKRSRVVHKMIKLDDDQSISINCISGHINENTRSAGYLWIINSETREVVWELDEASYSSYSKRLLEYTDKLSIREGVYEVYFSSYTFSFNWSSDNFFDIFKSDKKRRLSSSDYRKMKVKISYDGEEIPESEWKDYYFGEDNKILTSITQVEDDSYEEQAFKITEKCNVNVYGLGEITHDGAVDYAWIRDLSRNRVIWKMNYRNTDHTAGGNKNRMFHDKIRIPRGQYILYYVSDDSHAVRSWNDGLPYDPNLYGVTLYADEEDADKFERLEKEDLEKKDAIIKLTRLRNNSYVKKSFYLSKQSKIRIYALGESDDEEMVDFSWIVNDDNLDRVWEMEYDETQHAGGSKRNRLFDGEIELDKGNYTVYAVTNRKHAYNNWKYSKPYDKRNWGIMIFPTEENTIKLQEKSLRSNRDNIIAQIVEVGDNEKERVRFSIDKDQDVVVYAIGEGDKDDDEMYDYGWIKDAATGRVVWRMQADDSDHAGGASKNRKVREKIRLKKGDYKLYYRSDGSHSYAGKWNSSPPYDQQHWGITIYKVKKKN